MYGNAKSIFDLYVKLYSHNAYSQFCPFFYLLLVFPFPIYKTAVHSISTSVFSGRVLTATHLFRAKMVSSIFFFKVMKMAQLKCRERK